MIIYFSNTKLWNTYFKISVIISVLLLLLLPVFYQVYALLFGILALAILLLFLGFQLSQSQKRVFLEIENNRVKIRSLLSGTVRSFDLKDVKSLRRNRHYITFVTASGEEYEVNLSYINGSDTRKLTGYLKYHPAIQNKKFFM